MKTSILCGLAIALFCCSAVADEIVFINGERLAGKVVKLEGSQLTFLSEMAGVVHADLSTIRSLTSDRPVAIYLPNGTVVHRKLVPDREGRYVVEGAIADQQQMTPLPPQLPAATGTHSTAKWSGSISAGGFISRGNYHADIGNLSLSLTRRDDPHRSNVTANYYYGTQENTFTGDTFKTQDNGLLTAKHDVFLYNEWYAYAHVRAERNALALLEARLTPGAGIGYQWVENKTTSFSTEIGGAWFYENYVGPTPSDEHIALRLAYQLEHKLTDRLTAFHRLEYYPNVDEFSDWFLTTEAGLRYALTSRLFTELRVQMDHDSAPRLLHFETDVRYFLSLGLNF